MLVHFSVKNYKCLRDVSLPLTRFHVLIGENDAGKTSFLQAIAAYCASNLPSDCAIPTCFAPFEFGPDLVGTYAEENPIIELAGRWTPTTEPDTDWLEYGFAFEIVSKESVNIYKESIAEASGAEHNLSSPNRTSLAFACYTKNSSDSRVHNTDRPILKRLRAVFQNADLYAFNPRVMAMPSLRTPEKLFKMEYDGFGLANLLEDILGTDPKRYLELQEEFCRYFPQFRAIRVRTMPGYRRERQATERVESTGKGILFVTQQDVEISARHVSDGAILFLAYLALSFVPKPPAILLLEEPENSVYPKRLQEIIDLLRRYSSENSSRPTPQIIMTTHSPFVVSFFEPEEVSFFYRSREHSAVAEAKPLRDVPGLKERLKKDELYLGELWYNWDEEAWLGISSGERSAH